MQNQQNVYTANIQLAAVDVQVLVNILGAAPSSSGLYPLMQAILTQAQAQEGAEVMSIVLSYADVTALVNTLGAMPTNSGIYPLLESIVQQTNAQAAQVQAAQDAVSAGQGPAIYTDTPLAIEAQSTDNEEEDPQATA